MLIKSIVVDNKLPLVLGMSFLELSGVTIDYATKKLIMQLADSKMIELQGQLNAPEKHLSNVVSNALKGFAKVASHDVYMCSEK